MRNLDRLKRPHHSLFLAAVVLIVLSVFFQDSELDIHLHDTYLVSTFFHIFWGGAYLLLAFWLLYTALRKLLTNSYLTWIHIITMILFLILIFTSLWQYRIASTGMTPSNLMMLSSYEEVPKQLILAVLLFAVGLLSFIANLLLGIGTIVLRLVNRGRR